MTSSNKPGHGHYGRVIIDGELQYSSPSAIAKFHECQRSWGFRYIEGIREPSTQAQTNGIEGHGRIEHYLKTGENVLTPLEQAGAIWIPEPYTVQAETRAEAGRGAPTIAGLPIVMVVDAFNNSGRYVDPEGNVHEGGDVAAEVLDWKFTGARDPKQYAKTPSEVADALPMCCYGVWANDQILELPDDGLVRLSHVYFSTKRPDAFKRTALVTIGSCRARLAREEPTIAAMRAAAGASCANDLEPNFSSCGNWGGCFFADRCSKTKTQLIDALFGSRSPLKSPTKEGTQMSLLDKLMPEPPPAPSGDLETRIAALEAQEVAADPDKPIRDAIAALDRGGLGYPVLRGDAMVAVYRVRGLGTPSGSALAGSGRLAQIAVDTVPELIAIAAEVAERTAPVAAPPPAAAPAAAGGLLAPGAPVSTPQTAAIPVPAEDALSLPPAVRAAAEAHRAAVTPPPAAAPASGDGIGTSPGPEAPKKRGRPAKPKSRFDGLTAKEARAECERLAELLEADGTAPIDNSDSIRDLEVQLAAARGELAKLRAQMNDAVDGTAPTGYVIEPAPGIELYVDCLPLTGARPAMLDDYVDGMADRVAAAGQAPHILAAGNDSPIAFGKWKGYLTAAVQADPPVPGRYMLITNGDEVRRTVADALRSKCSIYVRGF